MTKTEAITYYKTNKALSAALQRSKATVSGWPEELPRGVQFELQVKTGGLLRANSNLFNSITA